MYGQLPLSNPRIIYIRMHSHFSLPQNNLCDVYTVRRKSFISKLYTYIYRRSSEQIDQHLLHLLFNLDIFKL